MSIYQYKNFKPEFPGSTYIAPSADVIGNVILGENVNIWHQSVLRGDVNSITIGANTNIQDLCMLHVTEEAALEIGANTSVGHHVTLHGCQIGAGCLIGMSSTILDGAQIGDECLVAAGSVVAPGKVFPAGSLIKGIPAKVERALTTEEREKISLHFESYLIYKEEFKTAVTLLS
jgi:gamma-carbonic anhydrase